MPSPELLGHMLSFAAGIMTYISFGDLMEHAKAEITQAEANIWVSVNTHLPTLFQPIL
jgi:hypothetical protein